MRLAGKTAIVTGAGAGIGRCIALMYGREGAQVVAATLTGERGLETLEMLKKQGTQAIFVQTDVRREADARRMVEETVKAFGKVDVLCNNAAITSKNPVTQMLEKEWDNVLDTNLKSIFLCSKYAIPEMVKQAGGAIVNIASIQGVSGLARAAAYCASKGGVVNLTRQMALDFGPKKIRTNCVLPGFIDVGQAPAWIDRQPDPALAREWVIAQHPIGRMGTAEDVAYACIFLASDEATFINGAALAIDGGYLAA